MLQTEISIIVPIYNSEKYVQRCVESILKQTFASFELILVDDGSTDKSPSICDNMAKQDDRIKVIHKRNGGVSSARNVGIDISNGKYIMFCDSDDYVATDWCEILFRMIENSPNAWCVSNICRVTTSGKIEKHMAHEFVDEISEHNIDYFRIYEMGLSGYTVNKIYRLDVLREKKIRFNEDRDLGEDAEFNIKYFESCDEIKFYKRALYYYTDNPEGAMKKYRPNIFELNLSLFWERVPFIEKAELGTFCDNWIYRFIHMFDEVFDIKNKMSFIEKMRYNQHMMNSKEFRFCVQNAEGKNENPKIMKILSLHNYYLFWVFQNAVKIKQGKRGN